MMYMKLSEGIKGKSYKIKEICLDIAVVRRLHTLGMTDGSDVKVVNLKKSGPMIINIRGTRFAIGKGFCENIFVEEVVL